jgi:hypothetical protein
MARIRLPTPFIQLMQYPKPEYFVLMSKYKATDTKGKYLHWNDFKWRVEKGDEEESAWVATKLSRRSISKDLVTLPESSRKASHLKVGDIRRAS